YGTTFAGGSNNTSCAGGCGTVFKITPSGTVTTLHSFCSRSGCTDGATPQAGLVQDDDGNFYGTTFSGGTSFLATIFRINAEGALTTLHSFGLMGGGCCPVAALVQASDGNFYGTTLSCGVYGFGTIFKITPAGALTTLHNFDLTNGSEA